MSERRSAFLFRLPWLRTIAAKTETQTLPQSANMASIPTTTAQRPPFRPQGVAPVQPSPIESQALPRTESQPPSPAQAAPRSRDSSQPASPSRVASQSKEATQTSSPSRTATQSRAASQPSSSRTRSRTNSQSQPASQSVPQSQLPSLLASPPKGKTSSHPSIQTRTQAEGAVLQAAIQDQSQRAPSSGESQLSILKKKEPRLVGLKSQQPEAEVKTQIRHRTLSNGKKQAPAKASQTVVLKASTSYQTSDSSAAKVVTQHPGNSVEKKEKKKNYEESKTIVTRFFAPASASGLRTETKVTPPIAQHKEIQVQKREIPGTETLINPVSKRRRPKANISNPEGNNVIDESDQKPVALDGEMAPLHKEIKDDISKCVNKLIVGEWQHKKPVSVITLAGENRGASMQLGQESAKQEREVPIRRGYKMTLDESTEVSGDEGEQQSIGESSGDSIVKEHQAKKAYLNSNIQSINNSIVLNSSIAERNPGIQMEYTLNPTESIKPSKMESIGTDKAKLSINPPQAQKLRYEPTIRRRCLRGLFMEPSDSEPDNPEKPRRHGCRYSCKEKI